MFVITGVCEVQYAPIFDYTDRRALYQSLDMAYACKSLQLACRVNLFLYFDSGEIFESEYDR